MSHKGTMFQKQRSLKNNSSQITDDCRSNSRLKHSHDVAKGVLIEHGGEEFWHGGALAVWHIFGRGALSFCPKLPYLAYEALFACSTIYNFGDSHTLSFVVVTQRCCWGEAEVGKCSRLNKRASASLGDSHLLKQDSKQ